MSRRTWQLVAAAALFAGGVVLGRELGAGQPASRAPARETRVVTVPLPGATAPAGLDVEELRDVIREELRAAAPAPAARGDTDPRVSSTPPVSTARAEQVLDEAIARGAWRAEDRAAFRAALAELPGPERTSMMARFAASVNAGALRPETLDAPL